MTVRALLVRHFADAARARRGREYRPADWPAPRGGRDATGRWVSTLEDRCEQNCGSALEAAAVAQVRDCVTELRRDRHARGLTLRQLSERTGVALSVLTGLEQGSNWPSFPVLGSVAEHLELRIQLKTAAADYDWARAEQMWAEVGQVPAGWHQIVVQQLIDFHAQSALSARELALRVGLNEDTVGDLGAHQAPESWVTVKVLTALAAFHGTALEAVPRADPWPELTGGTSSPAEPGSAPAEAAQTPERSDPGTATG